jgi:molybdopterin converting factor subunit 1
MSHASSVRIKALLFAAYRDLLGTHELEFELPPGSTVAELIEQVLDRAGDGRLPTTIVVAVNQEYAGPGTVLQDGDEVALIPPVAGG